jgi:uncharacterized protein YprB with RNaseH-like and TPR domain
MLENLKIEDVIFLDIETVPVAENYEDLSENMQRLWEKKSLVFRKEDQNAADVYQRAGIYSEFGKIICISAGILKETNPPAIRIKSFYGDDEKKILEEFSQLLQKRSGNRELQLCAHNGKEFDYPYIARRMIINSLPLPSILDLAGKKPWEVRLLDTVELWKFGDYKSYTSLDLLTTILGIPSPKDDIDGSMVAAVYWKEKDIARITRYCEKDVLAVAQIIHRFMNKPLIEAEKVESVTVFT